MTIDSAPVAPLRPRLARITTTVRPGVYHALRLSAERQYRDVRDEVARLVAEGLIREGLYVPERDDASEPSEVVAR